MSAKRTTKEKKAASSSLNIEKIKKTPKKDGRSRTIRDGLKRLEPLVLPTTNAKEWFKFMDYIQKRMATFDPNSSTYIDYEQRALERSQPPKRFLKK